MSRRSPVGIDTSVLIAGLLTWHERHAEAAKALASALADPAGAVLPLHALIEAYAVMTRLPAPHRLRPADATEILLSSLQGACRLVTLDEDQGWSLLGSLAAAGIAGGRSYDALIAACARSAAAGHLLTLNARDFAAVAPELELIVP